MRAMEIRCPSCDRPPGVRCSIENSGRSHRRSPDDSAVYCRERIRHAAWETYHDGLLSKQRRPDGAEAPALNDDAARERRRKRAEARIRILDPRPMSPSEVVDLVARTRRNMRG